MGDARGACLLVSAPKRSWRGRRASRSAPGGPQCPRRPPARSADIAPVDALKNARELPVAERDVEAQLGEIAARTVGIALGERRRRGKAWRPSRGSDDLADRVALLRPVDGKEAEVGERIAQGADLPVEHRDDAAVAIDDDVVQAVVAMHDGRTVLLRNSGAGPPPSGLSSSVNFISLESW
jgi:hypothetical protein